MLPVHQKKSNVGVVAGVLSIVLAIALVHLTTMHDGRVPQFIAYLTMVMMFTGAVLWIYGCCQYAMAKGYSCVVGFLSLLGILGLLLLLVLQDRCKTADHEVIEERVA